LALAQFSAFLPAIFTVAEASGLDVGAFASHVFFAGSATGIEALRAKITSQSYRDDWDQLAIHSIDRSLLGSLIEIAKHSIGQADDPSESTLLSADGPLHETAQDIEGFGESRVPVSACFVLSERIRDRVAAVKP
jgi:NAD-specific glutamate dehydrogenase